IDLSSIETARAGYRFAGWFVGTTEYSGLITMPVGGMELEAHWEAEDQTLTFEINGGNPEQTPADIIAPTDSEVDLTNIAQPTREGFEFIGWNAEGTIVTDTFTVPAGGIRFVAEWRDLIAEGYWQLEADNIRLSLEEVQRLTQNG